MLMMKLQKSIIFQKQIFKTLILFSLSCLLLTFLGTSAGAQNTLAYIHEKYAGLKGEVSPKVLPPPTDYILLKYALPIKRTNLGQGSPKQGDYDNNKEAVGKSQGHLGASRRNIPDIQKKTRTVKAWVTAFTKHETCPNRKCITASGTEAGRYIAACPRAIPFGTKIRIGEERFICGDRLHPRFDSRFDIWFGETKADYEAAKRFGKQWEKVIIYR